MLPQADQMDADEILDELALYLRPPGQGIYAVSTGKAALEAATRAYLGEAWNPAAAWRDQVARAANPQHEVALLALPSDTGAGIVRGAAWGPTAIRERLGTAPVLDLGDVFTIPHLLEDELTSESQLLRSRAAIYPHVDPTARAHLPVAPLSITTRVYELLATLNPGLRVMLLGGDHTVTWPAMAHLLREGPTHNVDVGIVHFDAHTDLLPERLGVPHCFATWAYHANELLGGDQRMIQLGIRASGHDRSHWESNLDVRQVWAPEALRMAPAELAELVTAHLDDRGVRRVYVSNDLDGTDARWAGACGTPEPGGLTREHVTAVIDALAGRYAIIGADMVELAPGLSLSSEQAETSIETATSYTRHTLALLAAPPPGAPN